MGITRIERAIDESDSLSDDDYSCDDIRPAWLAEALRTDSGHGQDFDALWTDR